MLFKVANIITGTGSESAPKDEGTSLISVLETPALRVELALLVLLCIDAMRSDLAATFDPDKTYQITSSAATPRPASSKPRTPTHDLISFDAPQDQATVVAERARRERQQEIGSMQTQALRRSALTFFDKWRASVMHRICDVLCVRGDVVRQAKTRRKQSQDEAERQNQGISSLIDFDQKDPFASDKSAGNGKRKHGHYDVIESKILVLDEQKRELILHCLLLLLLSLEQYPAHSRVLLLQLASSLELETDILAQHEKSVAQGLLASAASQMDAEETTKRQASNDAASRKWKVGLAAVGGAVLIGVTGGLAAPLLAAGLGTVMGGLGLGVVSTYLGALAGSSVLVGSLFGAYGAKMTGRLMDKYAKEVQDFEFVPIQDPERPTIQRSNEWADEQDARDPSKREQHRLRVLVGISGWLSSPSDVNKPWDVIDAEATEPFALRFELDAMLRMGNSLNDVLFSYAWDGVAYTVISRTLLGALYAGLWPLGLVKAASVLDNPFSVAIARADKAGKVLAHALIDGVQGKRPVTLMGYSIGARVIYACLVELVEQHAFGLVESVVLMGAPAPSDSRTWRQIRGVVAARVVNVYSTEDYILGFLYRSTKLEFGVAGLQEIAGVYGIENFDMSKLVTGHDKYRYLVGSILAKVGFGELNFNRVAEQQRAMEVSERKKQQIKEQTNKREGNSGRPIADAQVPKEMPKKQGGSQTLIDLLDDQHSSQDNYTSHRKSPANTSQPMKPTAAADLTAFSTPSTQPVFLTEQVSTHSFRQHQTMPSMSKSAETTLLKRGVAKSSLFGEPEDASLFGEPAKASLFREPTKTSLFGESVKHSSFQPPANKDEMRKTEPEVKEASNDAANTTLKPVVPVTSVEVVSPDAGSEDEGQNTDNCDDGDDEFDDEFGELSMVEPVPMDDFDHGLM